MKKVIITSVIAIVLLVVGLAIGIAVTSQAPAAPSTLSGDIGVNQQQFTAGDCLGQFNSGECENTKAGIIKLGQDQAFWKNDTGRTVYVDLADIAFLATSTGATPTASSTMVFSVATSTGTTLNEYSKPYGSLIDAVSISTSSVPLGGTINNMVGGTNGKGEIAVTAGQSVVFLIRSAYGAGCVSASNNCETATSTNRGFNAAWSLHYHYPY